MDPGDGFDNDCDGAFDEEIKDGIDNDGDGRIDEDLEKVEIMSENIGCPKKGFRCSMKTFHLFKKEPHIWIHHKKTNNF